MNQLFQTNRKNTILLMALLAGTVSFLLFLNFSPNPTQELISPGTLAFDKPLPEVGLADCGQSGINLSTPYCYGTGTGTNETACAQNAFVACTNECSNQMDWYLNNGLADQSCSYYCKNYVSSCPNGVVHIINYSACGPYGPTGQGDEMYSCTAQGHFTIRCTCT